MQTEGQDKEPSESEIDWYFDFISPFAHIASHRLAGLFSHARVRYRPILFAALLNHHGQKGPAEVPAKRIWTYRWCNWLARQHGIPLQMPASHPFNPIPFLRMALARQCEPEAVRTIFDALWVQGKDPASPDVIASLTEQLGLTPAQVSAPEIKQALRQNTDQAIAAGVFGVPTLIIHGELFWGVDAMGFAESFLRDPSVLETEDMQKIASLPVGASRI